MHLLGKTSATGEQFPVEVHMLYTTIMGVVMNLTESECSWSLSAARYAHILGHLDLAFNVFMNHLCIIIRPCARNKSLDFVIVEKGRVANLSEIRGVSIRLLEYNFNTINLMKVV